MQSKSYLTREQLRYIRRMSYGKNPNCEKIYPMVDFIFKKYEYSRRVFIMDHDDYRHDMHYILKYWPVLEVHLYISNLDPRLMTEIYQSLEGVYENWSYYEDIPHNRNLYDYYEKVRDIIPTVRNAILLCR